jgi:hypothetical protein
MAIAVGTQAIRLTLISLPDAPVVVLTGTTSPSPLLPVARPVTA